uniref:Uncharacterized protein n=1 Tax=Candidatus Kentrum sp. TC TaxID=2126339 RepID=A0A451A1Q1_9GAMM|nr:MAG: hypothetical protein BECKTC1821E_GA0114239_110519 [Candidatus Kentron sp. TC]VFK50672.1 MAG: hypothetical protein BECKTC1821D_GA0114238_11171 [Candidatus Kentron sp. TC]VFK59961.1 MAG: hypothetical protein BECKTC1821F_GA0114240_103840 [Candidatus Kentron sp. TC]
MRDFFYAINNDSKLASKFSKELIKHRKVLKELHDLVSTRVKEELKGTLKEDGSSVSLEGIDDATTKNVK